jgi:stage II sporulation SpoM-like protein
MSEQPLPEQPPLEPEPTPSLARQLFQHGRLLLFAGTFAVELAIYFGAMAYPIDPVQQQALQQEAQALANATIGQGPVAAVAGIFVNNLRIALLEMIPVAGALLFAIVTFSTGQVIQVEAIGASLPGPAFGLLIFIFPFAILELSSYAIAVGSGSMLVVAWRRRTLHKEIRVFALEVCVVAVAVLVAAAMETMVDVNVLLSLALWLPTALAIAMIAVYGKRLRS